MRIEFSRSGGVAGLRINKAFDTAEMNEQDARELSGLVESSSFFALPESMKSTGADHLQYKITIEHEGQKHTVIADEQAMPEGLGALARRLTAAARSDK